MGKEKRWVIPLEKSVIIPLEKSVIPIAEARYYARMSKEQASRELGQKISVLQENIANSNVSDEVKNQSAELIVRYQNIDFLRQENRLRNLREK